MLASLAALALLAAPSGEAALPGVWQGTVGGLPVRACFVHRDRHPFGAYFYMSRLRSIPLEAEEGVPGGFAESGTNGGDAAHWRIEQVEGDHLAARWTGGGRTLPVRLTRIAGAVGDESPCASLAFHRPRLAGLRTVASRASADGTAYTRIALDPRGRFEVHVQTFALGGADAATRRINAVLARPLGGDPPQWFDCIRDSLEDRPLEGGSDETLEPVLISARWLTASDQLFYSCGGLHPDGGLAYRSFDRATGEEIDLHDWLNDAGVAQRRPGGDSIILKALRPALRDVILTGWRPEDPECVDIVRSEEFWSIGLTRAGFVFVPDLAHAVQVCAEAIHVPLTRMAPFLTRPAAHSLRALRSERIAR